VEPADADCIGGAAYAVNKASVTFITNCQSTNITQDSRLHWSDLLIYTVLYVL